MYKSAAVLVLITSGVYIYFFPSSEVEVPQLPETFWGPEKYRAASTEIRPFKINVSKSVIDDLNQRLDMSRTYVEPLEDAKWTYGISSTYFKTILEYWRSKYNWEEREKLLNKYPQFITNIQGLNIHFYHIKPTLPKNRKVEVLPLLIVHGWPGSVVEFQKIIPLLTTPHPDKNFIFEVIAPSLPGYGFSDGAVRPGLGSSQIAGILKNLMLRLGFEKFYTQGGDWGSIVTSNLAVLYPQHVLGVHSNMCVVSMKEKLFWILLGAYIPSLVIEKEHYSKMYPLSHHASVLLEESGYMHLQASKPDTIGIALSSSPQALAAYILEKFSSWTNMAYKQRPDGGLLEKFTMDELLDNVMYYWVTNSITTSVRLYAEQFNKTNMALSIDELPVKVPSACAAFPHELMYRPEHIVRARYQKLAQFSNMPRGGHFAAFEEPGLLADDIFAFVKKVMDTPK
ncbi:hypothetical protein KM043_018702 [Ampulex compressa]|nr:hypothetical protein KM043_018702 [Ampulex compressa]